MVRSAQSAFPRAPGHRWKLCNSRAAAALPGGNHRPQYRLMRLGVVRIAFALAGFQGRPVAEQALRHHYGCAQEEGAGGPVNRPRAPPAGFEPAHPAPENGFQDCPLTEGGVQRLAGRGQTDPAGLLDRAVHPSRRRPDRRAAPAWRPRPTAESRPLPAAHRRWQPHHCYRASGIRPLPVVGAESAVEVGPLPHLCLAHR
jgi:hypothetical protein